MTKSDQFICILFMYFDDSRSSSNRKQYRLNLYNYPRVTWINNYSMAPTRWRFWLILLFSPRSLSGETFCIGWQWISSSRTFLNNRPFCGNSYLSLMNFWALIFGRVNRYQYYIWMGHIIQYIPYFPWKYVTEHVNSWFIFLYFMLNYRLILAHQNVSSSQLLTSKIKLLVASYNLEQSYLKHRSDRSVCLDKINCPLFLRAIDKSSWMIRSALLHRK